MATIEKRERKNGTVYLVDIRIRGFPRQKRTFSRLADAKRWAQETEVAIRRGEFTDVVKSAATRTVGDLIARYRAEIIPQKAPTTQAFEETYLVYWERQFGPYALSYVTPERINAQMAELAKPTAGRSRGTLKHYRDSLNRLFNAAKRWGWIATNPVEAVTPITKIRNERVRYLDDDERERLLLACKESPNPYLYTVVVFALSTGARKNEILGLTFADVSLARRQAVLRNTKNGETRSVPVVGHLSEILEAHMGRVRCFCAALPDSPGPSWLFPRSDGQAPQDIRKAWENARAKAGIADFRFHDLRHSTASYLAMNGANLLEIADILGHKTLQMVKRYAHLSDSHKREILEKMNEKIL